MSPPKKELDKDIIYDLAKIHCTMNEIASVCDCSVDTLERSYADIIKKGRDEGKSSLKRLQWKAAEAGNITMMIWLGKQTLGQSDRVRSDITSGGDKIAPLTINVTSPEAAEALKKLTLRDKSAQSNAGCGLGFSPDSRLLSPLPAEASAQAGDS